jgi:hypothetical protein
MKISRRSRRLITTVRGEILQVWTSLKVEEELTFYPIIIPIWGSLHRFSDWNFIGLGSFEAYMSTTYKNLGLGNMGGRVREYSRAEGSHMYGESLAYATT